MSCSLFSDTGHRPNRVYIRFLRFATLFLVVHLVRTGVAYGMGPITIVEGSSATDSIDKKSAVATCPAGTIAFSGGAVILGSGDGVSVIWSQSINAPPNEWMVWAQEMVPTTASWYVTALALCAEIPGYEKIVEGSALNSDNEKSVSASCPPGKAVIGAGTSILSLGSDRVLLDGCDLARDTWYVRASEYAPTNLNWLLGAMVSCAPDSDLDLELISAAVGHQMTEYQRLTVVCSENRTAILGGWSVEDFDPISVGLLGNTTSYGRLQWDVVVDSLVGEKSISLRVSALCLSSEIFSDGFEPGSTGMWSGTFP